jgi:hypothetical protein
MGDTARDPFSDPTSEFRRFQEFEDRLLLIRPTEFLKQIATSLGTPSDAVDAQVVVLDGDNAPEEVGNVRFFGQGLVPTLKNEIMKGGLVLGILGKGEKKPGKNAPWILFPATDEKQRQVARDYLEANPPKDPFSNPS